MLCIWIYIYVVEIDNSRSNIVSNTNSKKAKLPQITTNSLGIANFPVLPIENQHISLIFRTFIFVSFIYVLKCINRVLEDNTLRAPKTFLNRQFFAVDMSDQVLFFFVVVFVMIKKYIRLCMSCLSSGCRLTRCNRRRWIFGLKSMAPNHSNLVRRSHLWLLQSQGRFRSIG